MSNTITRPLLPDGVEKTYVEIGGVKWATMNIGANSVTDYGLYFQWGDTTGYTASQVGSSSTAYKKPFNMTDCVLHNGTSNDDQASFTKYNGYNGDRLTVLEPINDAAVANWGGNWRMPTAEEFYALGEAVNASWVTNYNNSGINGLLCVDKTDSSKTLFFPAAGFLVGTNFQYGGARGYYWSSSILSYDDTLACYMGFSSSSTNWQERYYRYAGNSIRPVLDE